MRVCWCWFVTARSADVAGGRCACAKFDDLGGDRLLTNTAQRRLKLLKRLDSLWSEDDKVCADSFVTYSIYGVAANANRASAGNDLQPVLVMIALR
jgi:hypothetical protein